MSTVQIPISRGYVPSLDEAERSQELFAEILAEVAEVIAPVWPLQDYVAVNPYAGISHRSFLDARAQMKVFSNCESLMPMEYYAAEFQKDRFTITDIELAIEELKESGVSLNLSASQIAERLNAVVLKKADSDRAENKPNHRRPIRTIAEYASGASGVDWNEAIVEEVSKHCAAHYDRGQSLWSSPYKDLPLYQAWRTVSEYDCNIEILGLNGFRRFVAELPYTPEATIVLLLRRLRVPPHLWSTFLLCQAFSIPGWCAWTKYHSHWTDEDGSKSNDLIGLLAIRLAYDTALAEVKSMRLNWSSLLCEEETSFDSTESSPSDDSMLRYVLLRASEIRFRNELLASLSKSSDNSTAVETDRKLAQMVFCIDVRSERIRRQLETQSSDIETFGFAGFFGMAFEYVTLGRATGSSQLPVLLKPQFKLREGMDVQGNVKETSQELLAANAMRQHRSWLSQWKSFQVSAVSCFSFVETMGLIYGIKLFLRAVGYKPLSAIKEVGGLTQGNRNQLRPTLGGLSQQGITTSRLANMAEGMLRNLGLTKGFAQLVVLCGHACKTENNPLAAGLDCGACGGHSGEPNARFAALILNQPEVRQSLAERGICIPPDTYFLGALHNTTTDAIDFYDIDEVPPGQQAALQELMSSCAVATKQTQLERMPTIASKSLNGLKRRASDWSEVRPEWGLAGNAAFIVAPRTLTKKSNLDARSFLHSYDYRLDADGKVLETIMTAPMIVANWINMQYYASTVDNQHFGSGSKTVHNVVGGFGILSGNGGDLKTGLPWQSLHTGEAFQHLPLRLQVVIAAPRAMIERVIAKHETVANLLAGTWIHLIAIEGGNTYRYQEEGVWQELNVFGSDDLKGAL
jgi:uncharacterized protein